MNGYLKLHRSLLSWEWYDDLSVCRLWIHLLLRSNFTPGTWHGIPYGRGELITSLPSLSAETGLSIKQVRTALGKLKKTGEITCRGAGTGTLVSIANWDKYQAPAQRGARSRPQSGQPEGETEAQEGQQDNKERNLSGNTYGKKEKDPEKGRSGASSSLNVHSDDCIPAEEHSSVLASALGEFRRFREESGRPLTPRAGRMLVRKLSCVAGENEDTKAAILEQSVINGWTGIFPLRSAREASCVDPFLSMLREDAP